MNSPKFTRRFVLCGTLVTISALHLSGCVQPDTQIVRITSNGQFFSATELTVLNDVAEIMIPRTDSPGATDAGVAAVVDGLMITWAVQATRNQFRSALAAFDKSAQDVYGKPYLNLMPDKRLEVVTNIDASAFSSSPFKNSEDYRRLKDLIFRVFYTSEQGSADYVPLPGGYYGNLTLDEYEALMTELSYGG